MAGKTAVDIRVDAFRDWAAYARSRLAAAGFAGPFADSDLPIAWFNLRRRLVEPRPRRTAYASDFHCPPKFTPALAALISDSERGCSLVKYLSRSVAQSATFSDGLLNDWHIHHFHLGNAVAKGGFMDRTGELLFAVVEQDTFYALTVGHHKDFASEELFARLARNWPELVEGHRLDGDDLDQHPITDDERKKFRGDNLYPATVVDGAAYVPLGGGAVMSGASVESILEAQQLYYFLHCVEKCLQNEAPAIAHAIEIAGYHLPSQIELTLDFSSGGASARHVDSDVRIDVLAYLERQRPE